MHQQCALWHRLRRVHGLADERCTPGPAGYAAASMAGVPLLPLKLCAHLPCLFPTCCNYSSHSTAIEYKYVIRAGEGEVKAVVQWQPCNNLEVQAAPAQELTIRDAWEGEQHEVLPGTLPLPAPPATEPEPQIAEEEAPAAFTEAVAVEEPAATPGVAEAAAAAPEEVPEVVAAAAPAVEDVLPAAPAAVEAPETIKAAESATPAAAPGPRRRRSTTTSRSANGSKPVNGSNGSRKVMAAATTEVRMGAMPAHNQVPSSSCACK